MEVKAQIGHIIATPCHEGMEMISILIIPVMVQLDES